MENSCSEALNIKLVESEKHTTYSEKTDMARSAGIRGASGLVDGKNRTEK